MMNSKVNIVMYHPEIPQNTGNVMRTCVGTDTVLHLIKPYGFDLNKSENIFGRSSANYAQLVELREYEDWDDFVNKNPNTKNYCFITRYGLDTYNHVDAKELTDNNQEMFIIFGSESSGIDQEILTQYKDQTYRIPTSANVRSLNVSNCVMMVLYEMLRQLDYEGLLTKEPHKVDYLK